MEETLEKEIPPSEVKDSNEGGIRLRLRDRDLLKKRKAEAEEKATNQWVYGAQSLKRVKKKTSGTSGRKGRPRKEPPVVIPEDFSLVQETDPSPITPITEPVLPTIAETLPLVPAEPQPEPRPQLELQPELAPQLELQPEPEPQLELQPEPEPQLELQPELAPMETMSEKPLEFLIEDLGPEEEEDMPPKSLIIDIGDDEQPCAKLNSQVSIPVYPPPSAPSQPESLPEDLII